MVNRVLSNIFIGFLFTLIVCTSALAQDFGCNATITTLSGEKKHLSSAGVSLRSRGFLGYRLSVRYDYGDAIIDIRNLRSITKLPPLKKIRGTYLLKFSFETTDGQKGIMKINSKYYIGGEVPIGVWKISFGEVKKVVFDCVSLER
ncbi:MAG: hypothetical protein K9K66_03720 [Desulfarculaceae bacterium]|nr:hypothetical protein [Desulfarculaceae bacterium]MCF8072960.1 hypothetical protein [Desulfarculaceae bacterium]MCF8100744.1 hypothetical protein [Desulfarculaceae bacterium]MCF8115482.1 hypothetical protein [Desulfarculaceae bacterium]